MTKRVLLFTMSTGMGHDTTASAIVSRLADLGGFETVAIDIHREVLSGLDPFSLLLRIPGPSIYNRFVLDRGYSGLFWRWFYDVSRLAVRLVERRAAKRLAAIIANKGPAVVVSVIPLANRALAEALRMSHPRVPLLTVVIDFTEAARDMWFQHSDQHVICGTPTAALQARNAGIPDAQIREVALPPIRTTTRREGDRKEVLRAFTSGESSDGLLVGLMMFGGYGTRRMHGYARALEESELPVQMIYLCGHNPKLARALRSMQSRRSAIVWEFAESVTELMGVADFIITKPGPGTIAEAVAAQLPLIVEVNQHTLFQEKPNAEWAIAEGVGMTFRDSATLIDAVRSTIRPTTAARMRHSARNVHRGRTLAIVETCEQIAQLAQAQS